MSKDDAAAPQHIEDPNAALRHPLTVLVCLLPLSIIGELYRWIILKRHELLADEVWNELGRQAGIHAPAIPSIILACGCIAWMFIGKKDWTLPPIAVLIQIVLWALLWCLVRTVISFTNEGLQVDSVQVLGTMGLCLSGAVQEELIFRAVSIGCIAWLISLMGIPFRWCLWALIPVSAVLFALAHTHVMNSSITPEAWHTAMVVEHIVAGLIYGYIFVRQGLAVSTLTHFFFNLLVVSGLLGNF